MDGPVKAGAAEPSCDSCGGNMSGLASIVLGDGTKRRDGTTVVLCSLCLAQALTLASGVRFDRNLQAVMASRAIKQTLREEQLQDEQPQSRPRASRNHAN